MEGASHPQFPRIGREMSIFCLCLLIIKSIICSDVLCDYLRQKTGCDVTLRYYFLAPTGALGVAISVCLCVT